jgi:hypothetical protein
LCVCVCVWVDKTRYISGLKVDTLADLWISCLGVFIFTMWILSYVGNVLKIPFGLPGLRVARNWESSNRRRNWIPTGAWEPEMSDRPQNGCQAGTPRVPYIRLPCSMKNNKKIKKRFFEFFMEFDVFLCVFLICVHCVSVVFI